MSSEPVVTTRPVPRRRLVVSGVVGIAVVVGVVVAGVALRAVDARNLKTWTNAQAIPTVVVIHPASAPSGPTLDLPSRLEAYSRAPIFARVSGYLKSWNVDIGAPVKAGQLLAVIESPELDQQLIQARADLASAQANAALAGTTAKRWQALLGTDSVAQQEVDERTGDYTAKKAAVAAAQANVDRLLATKGFERIVAPFDGVVTARDTDVGALINAGSGGAGQELFVVSDVKRLRVYVQVPQSYAPDVRSGTTATLTVPEYPGQRFTARVVASADSVNAASGTTLVQLLVDNSDGKLLPGGFASLQFKLPVQPNSVRIPASALVFDAHGLRVATLGANSQVVFKTVTINRDFGDSVEIGAGLTATDRVIDTPPDGLVDGDRVQLGSTPTGGAAHG
ncbi:efflux RND transporter periplasmic adaptor subunit [Paraburkholderia caballeronis]|uniref:RND family efflux transporter, MFP subunit n=1 Tax=Paraburkholderia caballeronis TaxID=416943 RepID=A0A1H7LWF6_9BURK|nr:efflux RND transporter periplasmic adaptor subunit [Paraburkholderia caballeronis]PXW28630.1 RND family efflux transporter MFP subunit [Paraburkholderia caballeronis]PXX03996.1 RND family efflux transporter MFP subunit [Paraburkholderia caballeronis]RAK04740.1 RND family efflux transporter MFP subunit [Paraburkholderia caballeronis]SED67296.1 RND family efflux transporter, MFP subunit [Paraburkholderia caballeronis]SEL03300.1 RND family efflux transporter, MFP subunit [Paraburkholderia caba